MRVAVLTLSAWVAGVGTAAAENATVQAAIDGFIRPAYKALAVSTSELADHVGNLCAVPDKANLEGARNHFEDAVRKWARVETIRFGPVSEQNRLERIYYFPDRKGIGLRQVQAAIASGDRTFESVDQLAGKSVALQGFGALEFVLYGTGFEALTTDAGAHRCGYGEAVANNLRDISADISAEWNSPTGFAKTWANPRPDNKLFRDDTEAVTELFEVFVHGLEQVRDTRINAFLGKTPDEDKPKSAALWRSNSTVSAIDENLEGLKALFDASGLAAQVAGDSENGYVPQSLTFEFANLDARLREIEGKPIADLLADPAARAKLDYARVVTRSLSELFGVKLAGALKLSAGFSSLDGD